MTHTSTLVRCMEQRCEIYLAISEQCMREKNEEAETKINQVNELATMTVNLVRNRKRNQSVKYSGLVLVFINIS